VVSYGNIAGETDSVRDLRREVDELRRSIAARGQQGDVSAKAIDAALARRGPLAPVSTQQGRLQIGGLLQVWGYSIQNDDRGVLDVRQVVIDASIRSGPSNALADNDSFRVRRAELSFSLDVSPHISSFVRLDFARAATAFPTFPSNQGTGDSQAIYFIPCG
jgi:hypothetical protein